MSLHRNHTNPKILHRLGEDEIVGTIEQYGSTLAMYGWSKGGSFFIYIISEGHIQKIGTLKREFIESLV